MPLEWHTVHQWCSAPWRGCGITELQVLRPTGQRISPPLDLPKVPAHTGQVSRVAGFARPSLPEPVGACMVAPVSRLVDVKTSAWQFVRSFCWPWYTCRCGPTSSASGHFHRWWVPAPGRNRSTCRHMGYSSVGWLWLLAAVKRSGTGSPPDCHPSRDMGRLFGAQVRCQIGQTRQIVEWQPSGSAEVSQMDAGAMDTPPQADRWRLVAGDVWSIPAC